MASSVIDEFERYLVLTVLGLFSMALAGCAGEQEFSAPGTEYYYLNPNKHLGEMGKIILVGLENQSDYPSVSADMTRALFQAVQKRQLFNVNVVEPDDPMWRSLGLTPDGHYSMDQIYEIRNAVMCNAMMVGTITEYHPYPHMVVGLRLKLLDLTDGQLLWAFEQIWDTADKGTVKRLHIYFQSQTMSDTSALDEALAVVSPMQFFKFICSEVAGTMK